VLSLPLIQTKKRFKVMDFGFVIQTEEEALMRYHTFSFFDQNDSTSQRMEWVFPVEV
jgi:hypothetical protein